MRGVTEHPMMLTDDLCQVIAKRRAEVFVGSENVTGEVELYNGLRTRQGVDDVTRIRKACERNHDLSPYVTATA